MGTHTEDGSEAGKDWETILAHWRTARPHRAKLLDEREHRLLLGFMLKPRGTAVIHECRREYM